uniref:Uncharacterized protein n=1 Tax=Amphimedon queenslandica TaxID=400682 RepID=A0A1X7V6T8_AMPQE
MNQGELWGSLSKIDVRGNPQFGMLCYFVQSFYLCYMQMLMLRGYLFCELD